MRKNSKLIWQLYPSYFFIIIISLLAVLLYSSHFIENFFLERTEKDLIVRGKLLNNQISSFLTPLNSKSLDDLCKKIGKSSSTRITVILPTGKVIGDSEEDPSLMENHLNRPEILTAIGGTVGSSIRDSETLKIRMMYVSIPLFLKNSIIAVLRISLPITSIYNTIDKIQARIIRIGFFIALIASILSFFVSKWISKPIEEMKKGAALFSSNLKHRLHKPFIAEFAELADSMNQMAYKLEKQLNAVKSQKNEYEAVLSGMSEGVIAIDLDDKILNINNAACTILKIFASDAKTKSIQEVIRDANFHAFIKKAALSNIIKESDFILYNPDDQIINSVSAPLCDASDKRIGTILVLNDVSKIRNLEKIRKDFVANVSHELRTPLTAIKGFVETLFDIEDENNKEDRKRFLKIIIKHVNRLDSILEDLLALAKIENRDNKKDIFLEEKNLKNLIDTVRQIVQAKAAAKKITIELFVDDQIIIKIDKHLIEQALINLIDNAIKYSKKETSIQIATCIKDNELLISVIDNGTGIPKKHLSRIFERFYRVDKARSRELGGTGLGLSIVKHIATAHKGRVSVQSMPGKGSTFTIYLPATVIV